MKIVLNGNHIHNSTDLYQQLGKFICFPTYFGYNLDALYDVLTTITDSITVEITHPDILKERLGEFYYRQFIRVIEESGHTLIMI